MRKMTRLFTSEQAKQRP